MAVLRDEPGRPAGGWSPSLRPQPTPSPALAGSDLGFAGVALKPNPDQSCYEFDLEGKFLISSHCIRPTTWQDLLATTFHDSPSDLHDDTKGLMFEISRLRRLDLTKSFPESPGQPYGWGRVEIIYDRTACVCTTVPGAQSNLVLLMGFKLGAE
ncbi:predicted protein [Coccidioides posadasii str. Silveira]|uniref:Predicted protein n=1 Tax=Coccidioides posadasii (strain RMSCC 757 / Silveira) TaxID=443226 RepID=E9DBD8_COCPS|nr:predicted protein [Coccidioides posadasii str. Silveira]